jgi:hypothetical protein
LGTEGRAPLLIRSSKVPETAGIAKTDARSVDTNRVMEPILDLPHCKALESMENSGETPSPHRRLVAKMLIAKSTNLLQCHPLSTPPGQVLPLRNQPLARRAGQQGDAVPAHLITEVLASHADGTSTRGAQNIEVHVVPLL